MRAFVEARMGKDEALTGLPSLANGAMFLRIINRRSIRAGLGIAIALAVLGLCFFGDCTATKSGGILAPPLAEVTAVLRDAGTQWMVFGCAAIYLLAFVVLRMRLDGTGRM